MFTTFRKGSEVARLFWPEMALHIQVKVFTIPKKPIRLLKVKDMTHSCVSNLCFGGKTWSFASGNSLFARRVPPSRTIIVVFSVKYVVNFSIVFIFISYEGKDFYGVVSVGQLSFLCFLYYGRSHHMLSSVCM